VNLNMIKVSNKLVNKDVLSSVEKNRYAIIENWLEPEAIKQAKKEYEICLKELPLHAQGEKFQSIDLRKSPWRKQAIGSRNGSGEPYSQLLQSTYYCPENSQKFPVLNAIFSRIVQVRNELTDMRLDYGNNLECDEFWNACRVHHYPQGGGHMAGHRDTLFPDLLKDFKIPFLQIMVTLSSRGTDFHTGGGYILDHMNQKIYFETNINPGSLVLFDGNTIHGVDDIDSNELLDFTSMKGRMAMFVNLYKKI